MDYFNRETLGIEINLSLPLERVIRTLIQIISWCGKPSVICCDIGPENISNTITKRAADWGIHLEYIQPGGPQQSAYIERLYRTMRYEWLSYYHWPDLDEVQLPASLWMWKYNHHHPNMALGGITPKRRPAMAA